MLFWISLRIAIGDLTAPDTAAKSFLYFEVLNVKYLLLIIYLREMLIEILLKKLINLIYNLPIQNSSFLKLFHLGQELFAPITL